MSTLEHVIPVFGIIGSLILVVLWGFYIMWDVYMGNLDTWMEEDD